ncbi:MAG: hypothetical protein LBL92_03060, partial [Propionibacteriaceae bacterium]|nr:hypothetical protein [Propionibacteriaceae bacterium]
MRIKQRSIALVAATALLLTGMQVVAPVATADPEVVVGSTSSLESSAREMVQVDLTAEEQGASQLCSPYRSYIRIRSEMAIDYLNYGEYSPMFAS